MRQIIIAFFLLSAVSLQAQKIRFTDRDNYWVTVWGQGADPCTYTDYIYYGADSVIAGNVYRRMLLVGKSSGMGCTHSGTNAPMTRSWIREDTALNIVYYRASADSPEYVLYNYMLAPGDLVAYGFTTDSVTSAGSVMIDGVAHRTLTLQTRPPEYFRTYLVVEGIGATNEPLFPMNTMGTCRSYSSVLCSFARGGSYPEFSAPIYTSCLPSLYNTFVNGPNCAGLGLPQAAAGDKNLSISPNPANTEACMAIESGDGFALTIYDSNGAVVFHSEVTGGQRQYVCTALWADGVYMVVATTKDGDAMSKRMVVSH